MKNAPGLKIPALSDIQLGSLACYGMALAVLAFGFWRLFSVESSDLQFLLGVLLVLNLAVMSVIAGLLLPVSFHYQQLAEAKEKTRQ